TSLPSHFHNVLNPFHHVKPTQTHLHASTPYRYHHFPTHHLQQIYPHTFKPHHPLLTPQIISPTHPITLPLQTTLKNNHQLLYITG
ncbi:methionine gamma-lyase family protein, partial [Staphylococcus epidermidis]|uniref:methionine gamma-lyase family protein n=1 Tax=Staphylococcus epidermidis TaxID=1282 RepID=UPI0016423A82